MTDLQRDIEVLINEGILTETDTIRFYFRYPKRMTGRIEKMYLGERANNCLRRAGIDSISQIRQNWDDLGKIRNSGKKTVKEIRNAYISYYYDLLNERERKEFLRDMVEFTNAL